MSYTFGKPRTYLTTTSTIKAIQLNTVTTQYTAPSTCITSGKRYITVPPAASFTTVSHIDTDIDGRRWTTLSSHFTFKDAACLHTGLSNTVEMEQYKKAKSMDGNKITSGLCPRYYSMVASIPFGNMGYLTMQGSPIPYSQRLPVLGVCCPWEPSDVGDGSGTDGEFGSRPYWRFGYHSWDGGYGNFTYLCHNGVDLAAVPIFVEWNQRTDPIATIYDKKEKNWEYAFYTSWPFPRTDTTDYFEENRVYTGIVPAAVSTNDPDPTNTAEATNYPILPPNKPRRPMSRGEITGTFIGCGFLVVCLVSVLSIWRRKRLRKARAAVTLAAGGDVPPAPRTAAELRASRLPVTRRVNTEEIDAPPLYSPSARDDEIPLERMALSSEHGGISTSGSEERLVRPDALPDAPPYSPPAEDSPFLNVPRAHQAPETPRGQAPPYTVLRD